MMIARFILQILPITAIGWIASGVGVWLSAQLPKSTTPVLGILLLLLSFLLLLALKQRGSWNVAVLMLFGYMVGSFTRSLSSLPSLGSITIALLLLGLGLLLARYRSRHWASIGAALWVLAWIYLGGWLVVLVLELDTIIQRLWAGFGLVLFTGMSAAWITRFERGMEGRVGSELGIDLYLLSLNLVIAARIVLPG